MNLRPEFRDIVEGWLLIDSFDDITHRLERAGEWTKTNGPLLPDEQATITLMIEVQCARADAEGFGVFTRPRP